MLLEQPSQYVAPSKGCADFFGFLKLLLFIYFYFLGGGGGWGVGVGGGVGGWVASLAESSVVFAIHLTNVFNMLFPCVQVFSQTRHLSLGNSWLLTDLLFLLFGGSYITPF